MADPLSVLGAAVGVTSLIIQITEECIKGFKLYNEAKNMPETYRYLRIRLQIEQQRFLNFALEAGILYADGVICDTLQLNRSLLLAVLAEIKTLLEKYATANGKYERFMAQFDDNGGDKDFKEPETALMELLCLPPSVDEKYDDVLESEPAPSPNNIHRIRRLGNTFVKTSRNIRMILCEPKRLVWVAVDKGSLESLIAKIEELNSFLITLLDTSQIRRLQDTASTTYLEVLQLRTDVESLTCLVQALSAERPQRSLGFGIVRSDNSALSHALDQEMEVQKKKREYLKQLVNIKIQLTKMDQASVDDLSKLSKFTSTCFKLTDFDLAPHSLDVDNKGRRTNTTYRKTSVWIEWKVITVSSSSLANTVQVENRISLLTNLLCHEKPVGFRAATCIGYVKVYDADIEARFGLVFQKPPDAPEESELHTLLQLLEKRQKPSLSARMSLCAILARCIHSFHAVDWLHKGLRSDNIFFFAPSLDQVKFSMPYASGFELSRPSIIENWTEKPSFDPAEDIYRHPNAQSFQIDGNYRKSYDTYSLGIVLLEIGLWRPIKDIIGVDDMTRIKPSALQKMQSRLLGRLFSGGKEGISVSDPVDSRSCLQQVAAECSDAFRDVAECCLTADSVEKPQYIGEPESSIALRLQKLTEEDIVKRLEHVSAVLQATHS